MTTTAAAAAGYGNSPAPTVGAATAHHPKRGSALGYRSRHDQVPDTPTPPTGPAPGKAAPTAGLQDSQSPVGTRLGGDSATSGLHQCCRGPGLRSQGGAVAVGQLGAQMLLAREQPGSLASVDAAGQARDD